MAGFVYRPAPGGRRGQERLLRWATLPAVLLLALVAPACNGEEETDPHVMEDGRDLEENPTVLSPPIVREPIYACTSGVVVQGFIPGAEVRVLVDGNDEGGGVSTSPSGQSFTVGVIFAVGQVVTAVQKFGGETSAESPPVIVRHYLDDYPDGPPQPYIGETPLYECGKAISVRGIVEGATLIVQAEPPLGGGGFDPPVVIGQAANSGAGQWVSVNPPFALGARVRAFYEICGDQSPLSDPEIVQPPPPAVPAPTMDPVYEGQDVVTVRNVVNGAFIEVFADGQLVGQSPTPGGTGQRIGINPPATAGEVYTAIQALCDPGPPSVGTAALPCEELPPAKIAPPEAGDVQVEVTEFVDGSRILIYADGQEVGDGGGPLINLVRPLLAGEQVIVVQKLKDCQSRWVYVIDVVCQIVEEVSNPSGGGLYAVGSLDYQLPAIPIGADSVRLWATVRYPAVADGADTALIATPKRLPLVLFLHGNHGTVRGPDCDSNGIVDDLCPCPPQGCPPGSCVNSTNGLPEVLNHEGYNYVLESLAKAGMIAISINANDLNCKPGRINERADLILAHLALWKGMDAGTAPNDPFNGKFQGRVDVGRIGLAGHSRGGEAVVRAVSRNNDPDLGIQGVLSLAPVDFHASSLAEAPLLMILPAADGDVASNAGARIYDRSGAQNNPDWFRSQMYVYGANHNYFNSQWLEDDQTNPAPDRMSRPGQEAMLKGWARIFFALTLQGQSQYLPVMSRDAVLIGLENARVFTSYRTASRRGIDHYQDQPDDATRNSLGGQVVRNGNFVTFDEHSFRRAGADRFNGTFFQETDGLVVQWARESPGFDSRIPGGSRDMRSFDYLTIRIGQVNDGGQFNDSATTMHVRLGASDTGNNRVDVESIAVGTIPFPYPHPDGGKSMVHNLRIPVACLARPNGTVVDLQNVAAVHVTFDRTGQGTLAVDDIEFTK